MHTSTYALRPTTLESHARTRSMAASPSSSHATRVASQSPTHGKSVSPHGRLPSPPSNGDRIPPIRVPSDAPIHFPPGARSPPPVHDNDNMSSPSSRGRFPAPPTGHELMAFFPAKPPSTIPEPTGTYPTSQWFQSQERAFFSRPDSKSFAGKSPMVAKSDVSMFSGHHLPSPAHQSHAGPSNLSPPNQIQLIPAAPVAHAHSPAPPLHFVQGYPDAHMSAANSRGNSPQQHGLVAPGYPHPPQPHVQAQMMAPPPLPPAPQRDEVWNNDPDEAWRRPIPHAERRRAGKHTKRIIVRT